MLTEEETVEIKVLAKQGKSLREIKRLTGRSVNTIRKYLSGHRTGYQSRGEKPRKISAYESYIEERLASVFPEWIPASVLLREIRALGYCGQIRQLQTYMATLKPVLKAEPVVRFETNPGEQVQIDWGHFCYKTTQLYAFVAVLGYSRLAFVYFMPDMKIETLLTCHQLLFEHLGGVPRQCLYDNMKTVVVARNAYGQGQHRLHPMFNDFAKHYGFLPRLCQPYRAKTKGKVERFISYLRHSFFIPLMGRLKSACLPLDVDTANLEVRYWLDEVANIRCHSTTQKRPTVQFEEERPYLQALPIHAYLPLQSEEFTIKHVVAWPVEHLQHSLHVYEALYQGGAL